MVTAMTVLIWAAISKCDWVRQAFLTRWHYWTVVFIWVQLVFPGDFRNSWQANSISTERYLAACVTSDSCELWEVRGTQCWRTYYCGDRKTRLITQGETQTSHHLLPFCMFYLCCVILNHGSVVVDKLMRLSLHSGFPLVLIILDFWRLKNPEIGHWSWKSADILSQRCWKSIRIVRPL